MLGIGSGDVRCNDLWAVRRPRTSIVVLVRLHLGTQSGEEQKYMFEVTSAREYRQ